MFAGLTTSPNPQSPKPAEIADRPSGEGVTLKSSASDSRAADLTPVSPLLLPKTETNTEKNTSASMNRGVRSNPGSSAWLQKVSKSVVTVDKAVKQQRGGTAGGSPPRGRPTGMRNTEAGNTKGTWVPRASVVARYCGVLLLLLLGFLSATQVRQRTQHDAPAEEGNARGRGSQDSAAISDSHHFTVTSATMSDRPTLESSTTATTIMKNLRPTTSFRVITPTATDTSNSGNISDAYGFSAEPGNSSPVPSNHTSSRPRQSIDVAPDDNSTERVMLGAAPGAENLDISDHGTPVPFPGLFTLKVPLILHYYNISEDERLVSTDGSGLPTGTITEERLRRLKKWMADRSNNELLRDVLNGEVDMSRAPRDGSADRGEEVIATTATEKMRPVSAPTAASERAGDAAMSETASDAYLLYDPVYYIHPTTPEMCARRNSEYALFPKSVVPSLYNDNLLIKATDMCLAKQEEDAAAQTRTPSDMLANVTRQSTNGTTEVPVAANSTAAAHKQAKLSPGVCHDIFATLSPLDGYAVDVALYSLLRNHPCVVPVGRLRKQMPSFVLLPFLHPLMASIGDRTDAHLKLGQAIDRANDWLSRVAGRGGEPQTNHNEAGNTSAVTTGNSSFVGETVSTSSSLGSSLFTFLLSVERPDPAAQFFRSRPNRQRWNVIAGEVGIDGIVAEFSLTAAKHGLLKHRKRHIRAPRSLCKRHLVLPQLDWTVEEVHLAAVTAQTDSATSTRYGLTVNQTEIFRSRPVLIYFFGRVVTVERALLKQEASHAGHQEFVYYDMDDRPNQHLTKRDLLNAMSQAEFCVETTGEALASLRLASAVVRGCIPVLLCKHCVFPFANIIAYRHTPTLSSLVQALWGQYHTNTSVAGMPATVDAVGNGTAGGMEGDRQARHAPHFFIRLPVAMLKSRAAILDFLRGVPHDVRRRLKRNLAVVQRWFLKPTARGSLYADAALADVAAGHAFRQRLGGDELRECS